MVPRDTVNRELAVGRRVREKKKLKERIRAKVAGRACREPDQP
jgi:hypothetical protein